MSRSDNLKSLIAVLALSALLPMSNALARGFSAGPRPAPHAAPRPVHHAPPRIAPRPAPHPVRLPIPRPSVPAPTIRPTAPKPLAIPRVTPIAPKQVVTPPVIVKAPVVLKAPVVVKAPTNAPVKCADQIVAAGKSLSKPVPAAAPKVMPTVVPKPSVVTPAVNSKPATKSATDLSKITMKDLTTLGPASPIKFPKEVSSSPIRPWAYERLGIDTNKLNAVGTASAPLTPKVSVIESQQGLGWFGLHFQKGHQHLVLEGHPPELLGDGGFGFLFSTPIGSDKK